VALADVGVECHGEGRGQFLAQPAVLMPLVAYYDGSCVFLIITD